MTNLQHISISTKEGWAALASAEPTPRPKPMTARVLARLSEADKARFDKQRRFWHANMGVLRTPWLNNLHFELWNVMDSNVQSGERAKSAVAVEGPSYVGKSTALHLFAKEFHQREIAEHGDRTGQGHERWPVVPITLSGHPTMRDLNLSLLHFFAHPAVTRGNSADFARRALRTFQDCEVKLLIVDDLHFLRWRSTDGLQVANHLKFLVNEFPITLFLIGTDLTGLGLYRGESGIGRAVLGPTARRTTSFAVEPYPLDPNHGITREWRSVVNAVEKNLVLARHREGTLTDTLCDYLYDRTTGYMGSLMTLINRAASRAIRTGDEAITEALLEHTKIDVAAEAERKPTTARRRTCTTAAARSPSR